MVSALLNGETRRGDDVTLTIDSQLCTAIPSYFNSHSATRGKNGAAVVMNYKTGEMIAQVSLPNFDPLNITADTLADPGRPFWNRTTQSVYPPGSSFKIITTVSALENIPDVTTQSILCTGGLAVINPIFFPGFMLNTRPITMTSQLTASVWVICTLPSSGTFSKVWRIRAPLMDTSIIVALLVV